MFVESQNLHYRAPVSYVTKTWSVVLLNKKHIYSYLKLIMYDKLLKPRQSFRITLYFLCRDSYLCEISLHAIKLLIVVENIPETYSDKTVKKISRHFLIFQ